MGDELRANDLILDKKAQWLTGHHACYSKSLVISIGNDYFIAALSYYFT